VRRLWRNAPTSDKSEMNTRPIEASEPRIGGSNTCSSGVFISEQMFKRGDV
jgi:hypothetical protein